MKADDMETVLSSDEIGQCIAHMAESIISRSSSGDSIAIIGIPSRGEILAARLSGVLSSLLKRPVPFGQLDITLFRDDLNDPHGRTQPVVGSTEIGFDIDGRVIILADDVLYTGRSTRAAMDALIDLGRPSALRLAVLIDRPGRELPIQADFVGKKIEQLGCDKTVQVNFVESDGQDRVIII